MGLCSFRAVLREAVVAAAVVFFALLLVLLAESYAVREGGLSGESIGLDFSCWKSFRDCTMSSLANS